MFVKGASKWVLEQCTYIRIGSEKMPRTKIKHRAIEHGTGRDTLCVCNGTKPCSLLYLVLQVPSSEQELPVQEDVSAEDPDGQDLRETSPHGPTSRRT